MNNIRPNKGEIWLIDLNPTIGREQAKRKPCLVISNNLFNHGPADLIVVLPITSQERHMPWHVEVFSDKTTGLQKRSFIMCEQPRTVSKIRFDQKPLGHISLPLMNLVQKRLSILLDFY